ncbi:MAG: hypothetical protein PHE59_03340 [Patescibacteria group bacterium]|nr:hypothetical protein [Patescibacteria group bacterium]MDD5164467.1 hypothetical protein [Patescibacteria group bacterium]MDD5534386.1 hypothetical protein [Patescibacteria group bacterium]MDD5626324.1 hypothetical protein [Patescibacteria group bacterium]
MTNPEHYHYPTIEQKTEKMELSGESKKVIEEVKARKNKGIIIGEQETYGKFFGAEPEVFDNAKNVVEKKNFQISTKLVKAVGQNPEKIIKAS